MAGPTQTTLAEFEAVFPKLQADLLEWAKGHNLPQQALDWYKQVSEFACRPARERLEFLPSRPSPHDGPP